MVEKTDRITWASEWLTKLSKLDKLPRYDVHGEQIKDPFSYVLCEVLQMLPFVLAELAPHQDDRITTEIHFETENASLRCVSETRIKRGNK